MRTFPYPAAVVLALTCLCVIGLLVPGLSSGAPTGGKAPPKPVAVAPATGHPSARWGERTVYDGADGYLLLFGGSSSSGNLADTWTYSAGVWTKLTPKVHPSARAGEGIAYDAADGYVVLFGGSNASSVLGDTWTYLAGVWTQIHPSVAPKARNAAAAAYDARDGCIVLFGGDDSSLLNDTWEFVHGNWTSLSPSISPPPRRAAGMTYDTSDGYVLLFGGLSFTDANDSWVFSAGKWTQLHPRSAPEVRVAMSMTYDARDGYVVLFGGRDDNYGAILGDTWTFHHGVWTEIFPSKSPSARQGAAFAYDTADRVAVLFGGNTSYGTTLLADTWTFAHGAWK